MSDNFFDFFDYSTLYPHIIRPLIRTWSSNISTRKLQFIADGKLSSYMKTTDRKELNKINESIEKFWNVQKAKDDIEEDFKNV